MKAKDKQIKAAEEYALRHHLFFEEVPDYETTVDLLNDGEFPEEVSPLDMFEYDSAEDIAEAIESMFDSIISIIECEE